MTKTQISEYSREKKCAEALRESDERFRQVFDEAPIGMTLAGKDFKFVKVNAAFCELIGYTEDELRSRTFRDITHPEDVPENTEHIRKLAAGELAKYYTEKRYIRKDKAVVWASLTVSVFHDIHGKFRYFYAIIVDNTERKRAEEALRENEKRYRTLFENMLNGFAFCRMIYDDQGRPVDFVYLDVNRSFGRLTGLRNVEGKRVTTVIPEIKQANPELFETYGRVALTGRPETFELYFKPLKCWLSIGVYSPQRGYFVAIFDNITERKQAVEALEESYVLLQKSFDDTVTAITRIVETRDPYTAGHQKHVSQLGFAMAVEMGLPEKMALGIKVAGLLHDVGKTFVPVEILSKPVRLTAIEFDVIKIHPRAGYDILRPIKFPWPVAEVAYQHQERMDGTGYPRGLRGEEILLETKIISVADTVEAMTFSRPYRAPIGLGKALEQIEKGKGKLYDPQAVDACRRLFKKASFEFHD